MESVQLNREAGYLREKEIGSEGDSAPREGKKGISGSTIKIIAVAAMLTDHVAAAVLTRQILANGYGEAVAGGQEVFLGWMAENSFLFLGMEIMRMIGRLGFPIFCFLLVEGFQKTRDVRKYGLRLGIFALVSEVPFDLAITGRSFHMGYQNVYFTLLLGLLVLWGCSFFEKWERGRAKKDLPAALRMFLTVTGVMAPAAFMVTFMSAPSGADSPGNRLTAAGILCGFTAVILAVYGSRKGFRHVQTACADLTVLGAAMFAAEYLRTDYGGMGVLTIAAMYLFRKRRVMSMLAGCVVLTILTVSELPAFLAVIPIALYNGKRGLRMKYFFYAFYPVHLLLLYVISVLLGLGNISLL